MLSILIDSRGQTFLPRHTGFTPVEPRTVSEYEKITLMLNYCTLLSINLCMNNSYIIKTNRGNAWKSCGMFIIYKMHKNSSRFSQYKMIDIKNSELNNKAPRFCFWVQTDKIPWHSVHLKWFKNLWLPRRGARNNNQFVKSNELVWMKIAFQVEKWVLFCAPHMWQLINWLLISWGIAILFLWYSSTILQSSWSSGNIHKTVTGWI